MEIVKPLSGDIAKNLGNKFWRLNNLYKIIDKDGNLVTFKCNPIQILLANESHPRYIIPKARQLGITTYHVLTMLDDVLFKANYSAVIQAHEVKVMETIFQKAQIAWREFPKELKQFAGYEVLEENKSSLRFNNYSSLTVTLSARSGTTNHLHVSELSKIDKEYPDKIDEIKTGSFPSVVPNGKITIESTFEQPTGFFADLVNDAFRSPAPETTGKDFKLFFFSWLNELRYQLHNEELYKILPLKYKNYQNEHSLSDDQITWYYSTQKSEKYTDLQMKQQYPTTLEEAMSANIDAYFDQENIKKRKEKDVIPPISTMNGWKIFEKFIPGHAYGMGADPAEGIGRDSSTAVIIDFSSKLENYQVTPKVVATFKSNKLDPLDFGELLIQAGNMYGHCIIGPERNNHGHTVIGRLKEKYRNIYQQVVKDYVEDRQVERYGFSTTASTKPELMSQIRQAIGELGIIIPDEDLLRELELYGIEDYKRIKNDPHITNHFDLVMALAIAWEMRHSARPSRLNLKPQDEEFDPNELI